MSTRATRMMQQVDRVKSLSLGLLGSSSPSQLSMLGQVRSPLRAFNAPSKKRKIVTHTPSVTKRINEIVCVRRQDIIIIHGLHCYFLSGGGGVRTFFHWASIARLLGCSVFRISMRTLRDQLTQLYQFTDDKIGLPFKMAVQIHNETSQFFSKCLIMVGKC